MIFDNSSNRYKELQQYMGVVVFNQFRNTQYYQLNVIKDAEKERFLKEQGLPVKTVADVCSNWRSTGMAKYINGKWYVNKYVSFNVQHELIHQNYSFTEHTLIK